MRDPGNEVAVGTKWSDDALYHMILMLASITKNIPVQKGLEATDQCQCLRICAPSSPLTQHNSLQTQYQLTELS